jgi:hypothetical protein
VAATHLADTSALAQLHHANVAARLGPLLVGGGVATCAVVDLELLASVPTAAEHAEMLAERRLFPRAVVDDAVLDRALEVQGRLGAGVAPSALIVAAAAEGAGLVLLHHDAAFDRIAEVTGQPVEWVGSET